MLVGTTPRGTVQRSGTPKTRRFNKVVHIDPQSSSLPKLPRAKPITREHAATLSSSMPTSFRLDLGKLEQSPLTPRRFTAKDAKESLSSTNRRAKLRSIKSEEPSPRITRQRSDAFSEADDAPDSDSSPLRKVKSLDDNNIESGNSTEPLRRRAITEMTFAAPVFGKFPKKQISFNESSTAPSLRKQHTVPAIPNFERARLDRLTTSTSPTKKDAEGYAKRHQALSPRSAEVPAHLRSLECIAAHIKENLSTKKESPKGSARGVRLNSARKYLPTATRRKLFRDGRVLGQRDFKKDPSLQEALSNPLQQAARLFENAFSSWDYPILPHEAFSMQFIDRNLAEDEGRADEQSSEKGKVNTVLFKEYKSLDGKTSTRVLKEELKLNPELEQVRLLEMDANKPMLLQRNLAFHLVCKFLDVNLSPEIDAGIHHNKLHTVMSVAPGEPGTGNKKMKRVYLTGQEKASLNGIINEISPDEFENICEENYNLVKARVERDLNGIVKTYADGTPIITYKANMPAQRPITDPQEEALVEAFDLLQVLDYLFCQIDRHLDNLFVEVEEDLDNPIVFDSNGFERGDPRYNFSQLTGIDGDFALSQLAYTPEFLAKSFFSNSAGLPPNPSESVMKTVEKLGKSSQFSKTRSRAIANRLLSNETIYILEVLPTQSVSECIEAIREGAEDAQKAVDKKKSKQPIIDLFNKVFKFSPKVTTHIEETEGRVLINLFHEIRQIPDTNDRTAKTFIEAFDPDQAMKLQKDIRASFPKSPQEAAILFNKYANEDVKKFIGHKKDMILQAIFDELSSPQGMQIIKGRGCSTLAHILKNLGFNYHVIEAAEARYDYIVKHFKQVRAGELKDIAESNKNSYAFRFKTQYEKNEANAKLMGPKDFEKEVSLPPKSKRPRSRSYNLRKSLTGLSKMSLGGRKTSPQKISKGLSTGHLSD